MPCTISQLVKQEECLSALSNNAQYVLSSETIPGPIENITGSESDHLWNALLAFHGVVRDERR